MISMKKVKIIMITLAVLILFGLLELLNFALTGPMLKPITREELIGKYSVPLPDGGKENLELLENGIYEQNIFLKSGKQFHARGKWSLDKLGSSDCISLEGARDSLNMFGNKINPDIAKNEENSVSCRLVTHSLMGHIKIGIYGDLGDYYRKVN